MVFTYIFTGAEVAWAVATLYAREVIFPILPISVPVYIAALLS